MDLEKNVDGKTYLRSDTIADIFGWNCRQMVHLVAKREGWQSVRGYHRYYLKEDVEQYAKDRAHTTQAQERGLWIRHSLIRHRQMPCPICQESKEVVASL